MEKKKSLVLQAKFLEEWKAKDGTTLYNHGVAFKNKDAGIFYCKTKEQDYFVEGHEVEYEIEKNDKEPKKSKIKPITAEKKESTAGKYQGLDIKDYIERKKVDAISFSASYAKDVAIADSTKDFTAIANLVLDWQLDKLNNL